MSKGSKAPPPPDPVKTAQAQAAANKETAISQARLNYVNQNTPYGSLTYRQIGTYDDGTPQFESNVTLTPDQQKILDEQTALSLGLSQLANDYTSRIRQSTSQPFTLEGLPEAPQADDAARQRIEAALFDRLNPQLERDQAAMETKLINQGLRPGTEAWTRAMDDMNRRVNDARLAVVGQGGQEMANLFSMGTTARANALNERLLERNQPINEVATLLGTGPGVQQPQFANINTPNLAPTDIVGPTYSSYQGQLAAWQDAQNTNRALMGGLFSLGAAGLGGWAYGGFKGL